MDKWGKACEIKRVIEGGERENEKEVVREGKESLGCVKRMRGERVAC